MQNNTTNIAHSFDYACEQSKKEFQAGISSLIELHSHFQDKYIKSLQSKKEGAFVTNQELKTICEWILELSGSQMAHYLAIDNVNRKTNKLFRCALKIQDRAQQTPNIRKLLA